MTTPMLNPDVLSFLKARVAQIVQGDEAAIAVDAPLVDLGLQSIDAVLLCGEIEDQFAIELSPAAIFEHNTLESFAAEVSRILAAR